ncbi:MAG: hypothetical protein H6729_02135 [Deltaproteobacteria bacterium]|nr:hypothetical protein [Deltaproteobacteria bacterium]
MASETSRPTRCRDLDANTKIYGRTEEFALETVACRKDSDGIYGRLRLWLAGRAIGDFTDDGVWLSVSARWGRTFLSRNTDRGRYDLDQAGPKELYHRVYGRFLADRYPEFENTDFGDTEPHDDSPFLLDDVGESSWRDRDSVIVIRRADGKDRVIVRKFITNETSETIVGEGVVDSVISEYCEWVESL